MIPQREIFWNISYTGLMYALAAISVFIFVYAFYPAPYVAHRQTRQPHRGGYLLRWKIFLRTTLIDGLLHRKFLGVGENLGTEIFTLRFKTPGSVCRPGPLFLFAGIILLFLGTATDTIHHDIHAFLYGNVYLTQVVLLDFGGLIAIIGVAMASFRRYVKRPSRLDNRRGRRRRPHLDLDPGGYRLPYSSSQIGRYPPSLGMVDPNREGHLFGFRRGNPDSLLIIHRSLWWFHAVLALGAIAYIALYWNRLLHIFVSPMNIYSRNRNQR